MRYDNAPEKSLVYSVFPHQKSKKKKSTFQKKKEAIHFCGGSRGNKGISGNSSGTTRQ